MNREFSHKILAIPVASAPETIAEPFTGFDQFHSDIAIDPQNEPTDQNGNIYYKFVLRIVQQNLSSVVKTKYQSQQPAILILFDTDGAWYQVGNNETPVRATFTPVKLSNEIKFAASLLINPF